MTIEADGQQSPIVPIDTADTKVEKLERNLTDKNILFLHHIKNGKGTVDAYEAAGYKGNAHSAYELRSYLKAEISKMLDGEGIGSKEGMLLKLKKLQELPLNQTTISVKEATELLKFEARLQPKEVTETRRAITPIVININGSADVKAPVDITPIDI